MGSCFLVRCIAYLIGTTAPHVAQRPVCGLSETSVRRPSHISVVFAAIGALLYFLGIFSTPLLSQNELSFSHYLP